MDQLFTFPFAILEIPHMKIKKPSWIKQPSAMFMFSVVLVSYFLVTGGNSTLFCLNEEKNLNLAFFQV